jgi:hypothetical protein
MDDHGISFKVVSIDPISKKPFTSVHQTISEATSVYAALFVEMGNSVRFFICLGPFEFEYLYKEKKFDSAGREFKIVWDGCDETVTFKDINKALAASQKFIGSGLNNVTVLIKKIPSDDTKLKLEYSPVKAFDVGRPARDTIISKEDILNLEILLNTETDFDTFLSKI